MLYIIREIRSHTAHLVRRITHDFTFSTTIRRFGTLSKVLNRRKLIVILMLFVGYLFPALASAAIAFDTSVIGVSGASSGPIYYTITLGPSDTAICIDNAGAVSATDSTTNVQIGTASGTSTAIREGGAQAPGDRYNDLWCLMNPSVGTVTVEVTFTTFLLSLASAYSGVSLIDAANTTTSGSATSYSISATPTVNNAWTVSGVHNANNAPTAGTGTTFRQNPAGAGVAISDSNGAATSAGSPFTMNYSQSSGGSWAGTIIALEPTAAIPNGTAIFSINGAFMFFKGGFLSIK